MDLPEIGAAQVMQAQFWTCVLLLGLLAALWAAASWRGSGFSRWLGGPGGRWLNVALAVICAGAAFNSFYLSRTPTWTHRGDLFHTVLASKYFEEVGYFGLYDCALRVDAKGDRYFKFMGRVRDLHNLETTTRRKILRDGRCLDAFSDERRAAFAEDLRFFISIDSKENWREILRGEGYDGTPFYTLVAGAIVAHLPLSEGALGALGTVDLALLAVAFALVFRAFGLRVGLLALAFFCVNFPGRFVHMGGSLLRFDYVALLMMGAACLRLRRPAAAGALVALATLERIFPILFAAGLLVVAADRWLRRGELDRSTGRFFAALAGVLAAGFFLTLTLGGGLDAWREFAENLRLHTQHSTGFRIGLEHLFMLGGNLTGPEGFLPFAEKSELFASRAWAYWLCVALVFAPVLLALRRLDRLSGTVVLFALAFFTLLVATRFYYAVLVLLFLLGLDSEREPGVLLLWMGLFAASAVGYQVSMAVDFAAFVYNTVLTGALAVIFAALVAWLGLRFALPLRPWRGGVSSGPAPAETGRIRADLLVAITFGVAAGLAAVVVYTLPEPESTNVRRPSSAPALADGDLDGVARLAASALRGGEIDAAGAPDSLDAGPALVYAGLREGGEPVGDAWAAAHTWDVALARAVEGAAEALDDEARAGVDHIELVFPYRFRTLPLGRVGTRFADLRRGVRGADLEFGEHVIRVSPTQMIASNRDFEQQFEALAVEREIESEALLTASVLRMFEATQVLVEIGNPPRAVRMFRGNRVVGRDEVTRDEITEFARRMEGWMQRNVQPDGRMVYQYWPSRGEESTANNMVRQFMASIALGRIARDRGDPESRALAERNLRYNLEHFYHEEDDLGIIEYDGTVKLGAIALAGLAIAESTARSEFAAEEASLLRTVDALRREDGTFQTFYRPEDREDGVNFYPGEALSLWAHLYHESPDPALLARIRVSQKRYARWHRRKRHPAFIPYHTMAAYRIWLDTRDPELRDWIFELNDWLVEKQEKSRHLYDDIEGRLYGPPHASATGVYLEGLADAFALALETGDTERIESYRNAIRLGLRNALQLEFRDDVDMFYVSNRDAVRGGLRTTVYDNEIRVDNILHVLMAVHKVLATFREEDFAQGS